MGRIQDLKQGGSILDRRRLSPVGENFEIQVLGTAISDVLRPSIGVLKSCFFKPKCHSFASKYCKTTLKIIKIMYSYSNLHLKNSVDILH